jgi:hypothetical protein
LLPIGNKLIWPHAFCAQLASGALATRLELPKPVMHDSSMKSETYPLAMPPDLLTEMRQAAKRTNLSIADAMRQSMRLGLPKLVGQLSRNQLQPLTKEENRLAYQTPNPEFDGLEHHCAALPKRPPEE